jgi:hypothetical protein
MLYSTDKNAKPENQEEYSPWNPFLERLDYTSERHQQPEDYPKKILDHVPHPRLVV